MRSPFRQVDSWPILCIISDALIVLIDSEMEKKSRISSRGGTESSTEARTSIITIWSAYPLNGNIYVLQNGQDSICEDGWSNEIGEWIT